MRTCRTCKATNIDKLFKPRQSICVDCDKQYMRDYRKRNRSKICKQVQAWKNNNRDQHRATCRELYATPDGKMKHMARVAKTPRTWLSHLLGRIKATSKKPGPHDPKSGPKRDYNLSLDYVTSIWEAQNGVCAITRLKMNHNWGDLRAVSIDRIDSSKGHIVGNIQLVCQCINRMKHEHTNDEIHIFMNAYFEERVRCRLAGIENLQEACRKEALVELAAVDKEIVEGLARRAYDHSSGFESD